MNNGVKQGAVISAILYIYIYIYIYMKDLYKKIKRKKRPDAGLMVILSE